MLLARALGLGFYAMLLLGGLPTWRFMWRWRRWPCALPRRAEHFLCGGAAAYALTLAGSLSADTAVLGLAFLLSALCLRGGL